MKRRAWISLARLLLASLVFVALQHSASAGDFPSLPFLDGGAASDGAPVFDDDASGPGLYGLKETMFWGRTIGSGRVAVTRVNDESTAAPGTPVLSMNDLAMNF